MKFKLVLFSCYLFLSINSYSQNINTNPFWEGEITLNDGTVKKGFVQVPNNPNLRAISFKDNKNGNIERVRKNTIKSLTVTSKSGNTYRFEPVAVVLTIKGNSSLGKQMLFVTHKNDYVKFYISAGVYRVDDNGEIYMLYRYLQGKDFPTQAYYIKKRDFEKARLVHMTGFARGFKKGANAYFTEDPELLLRINNNELEFSDINEIIEIYLETTKNL